MLITPFKGFSHKGDGNDGDQGDHGAAPIIKIKVGDADVSQGDALAFAKAKANLITTKGSIEAPDGTMHPVSTPDGQIELLTKQLQIEKGYDYGTANAAAKSAFKSTAPQPQARAMDGATKGATGNKPADGNSKPTDKPANKPGDGKQGGQPGNDNAKGAQGHGQGRVKDPGNDARTSNNTPGKMKDDTDGKLQRGPRGRIK